LIAAAKAPEIKARFDELGFEVVANNGADFAKFLDGEAARWKTVVEQGKISAN
jgi:tripartite-type tricarboxylate transporter receptor subunit TctC